MQEEKKDTNDQYVSLNDENENAGLSEQEVYRRLSDLTPGHGHITYKVHAQPNNKNPGFSQPVTQEKRKLLSKMHKGTFKRLQKNWASYDTEEVSVLTNLLTTRRSEDKVTPVTIKKLLL